MSGRKGRLQERLERGFPGRQGLCCLCFGGSEKVEHGIRYIDSPTKGTLRLVGLKPEMPQHRAGMRIEPAISVATPSTLPRMAASAASPPVEPPAVHDRFHGFSVRPKTLLCESAVIIVCGRLVLTYSTAPASMSISTRTPLVAMGGWVMKDA